MNKMGKKEIICTLGPSSLKAKVISRLEEIGVSLFRINLSHTRLEELESIISFVRANTSVPLCLDTEGAQVRTGKIKDNRIFLEENNIVRVIKNPVIGDSVKFNLYPDEVMGKLKVGDFISVDFNSVIGQVIKKGPRFAEIMILAGGFIGSNKAVSIERDIELPPLTGKDRSAISMGASMGIRHVALSFAHHASCVDEIRRVSAKDTFVISKIESIKGIINLEEIAKKSDALLLDRGDLARQIPIERIPSIQKDVIRRAKEAKTKIYVATNLLESMTTAPIPTRAEVNDIFNTLTDGTDGLVLAAETAIGSYPIHCATMVSKIIKQFVNFSQSYSPEELERKDSLLLVEPHGGRLVNKFREDFDEEEVKGYKKLFVDRTVLMDAEQIGLGVFSPVEGFMSKKELFSVLSDFRLPDGIVWPIPIVLQAKKDDINGFKPGETIALSSEDTREVYALLHIEDIYKCDLHEVAGETFGTNDESHPGARALKIRGDYFLTGKVDLIKRLPSTCKSYELTPRQTRTVFENRGWSKVVGFHTRNVIHRVHEHIQIAALEKYNCDGIFIHPIVGPKKIGDYSAWVILQSYEMMIRNYYPKGKALLGAFQSYSRYSGPREAVFTALCRKNFGCSHFIVGRDHTGVGNFYRSYDSHKLFSRLGDIGIIPIFFGEMHYCRGCSDYVEKCSHGREHVLRISGTEGRRMLKSEQFPPDWFMRRDISGMILDEIKKGNDVFVS